MKSFEDNLSVISRRRVPDFIAEMELGQAPFRYIGTDEDGTQVFVDVEGKPLIIESHIDKTNLPNPKLRQLIFFFGIGSLTEIQKVARCAHKDSLFIIIEPNPYFLQHVLYHEDFSLLDNINYILVTEKADKLADLFKLLFTTKFFNLARNLTFYFNDYYRKYDSAAVKEYVTEIGKAIKNKYFTIGNSIHDSLIGLINNFRNIQHLPENADVAKLKDLFRGIPAFVVAAGPSLDKNIDQLKKVQGKGIIIAVDTIVKKLLDHGITPDFVCTVERGAIVWEYFYENQEFPPNSYLVSSLVADPRIVEKFKDRAILPMRSDVREYYWLYEKLGLGNEHFMWMGGSCAHIAVGMALHIGASPIVITGQDLAYGENGTHAQGTVYDQKPLAEEEESLFVMGYYGEQVRTSKIWLEFKQIFEKKFNEVDRLIINATEGGAKIEGTIQQPLSQVVQEYCTREYNIFEKVRSVPHHPIAWNDVEQKIDEYLRELEEFRTNVADHLRVLKSHRQNWRDSIPEKKVKKIYETMKKTDHYYKAISRDQLLYHNIQGPVTVLVQKFQTIEESDSLASLKKNLDIQIELCEMLENTMWLIIQVIEENFKVKGQE